MPTHLPALLPRRARPWLVALLAVLAASPAALAAQEPLRVDSAAVSRHRSSAGLWAGAGVLLAGAVLLDGPVHDFVDGGDGPRWEPLADRLNPLGNPRYSVPVLAGGWALGKLADRPAVSEGAAHVLAGLLVAGVANGTLKYGVGRNRPSRTDDPFRFRPFNSDNQWQSFPSGHATVAFALAAGVSEEARTPWVTAASYGTAALVAWSRVYEDKHWSSDVAAGALVGTLAGRGTVRFLHRRAARREGAGGARAALVPGGVVVTIPTR